MHAENSGQHYKHCAQSFKVAGEILLQGSAKGGFPPLWEDTLGITASLTGELWLEHMGFSLHPCQPQWEAQSLFPSHQHPGKIQR